MSENIFQADQPESNVVSQQSQVLPELVEFVGEGKKYASVEAALKSVPHAQKHILTLEEELAKTKAELEKRRTAEELVEQIKNQGFPNQDTTPKVEGLDAGSVTQIVQQQLSQLEAQKKASENTQKVIAAFTAKFGDKAEEMYKKVAEESGLPISSLNQLAASSPNVVFKLAGVDSQPSAISKPTSDINMEAFSQNQQPPALSAKVKQGATTKDLVAAWKIAGEKVKLQSS